MASSEARRRPSDRRARILASAAELFARRGYAAVGIDEIGAAVGMSGPAIYRHFPGKDALLIAVLEHSLGRMVEELGHVDDLRGSVRVALDESPGLAVVLRESSRLRDMGDRASGVLDLQRSVMQHWSRQLRRVSPPLSRPAIAVRRLAVLGELNAVVFGGAAIPRPRVDELVAASAERIFASPAVLPRGVERPVWRPPATRRDEISRASIDLFRAHGFAGVGVAELAAASGISPATLYHHYRSKADVLLDAYDRVGQRVEVGVAEALSAARSPQDALERLALSFASIAVDNVPLIVVTTREADALPAEHRPRLRQRRKAIRQGWGATVRAVRPDLTSAEVRLVVSTVFEAMTQAAQAVEGRPEWLGEVQQVAVAHVGSEPS